MALPLKFTHNLTHIFHGPSWLRIPGRQKRFLCRNHLVDAFVRIEVECGLNANYPYVSVGPGHHEELRNGPRDLVVNQAECTGNKR